MDKLQKQVDFLGAHPGCPMCCHNARFVYENPDFESKPVLDFSLDVFLAVEDLLDNSPALSSTTMFRRNAALGVLDTPAIVLGDKMRAVALADRYGPVGYIDEVLSAWRVHGGGGLNRKWNLPLLDRRIRSHQTQIEFWEAVDRYLGYRFHDFIARRVVGRYYALAWAYARKRSWTGAFGQLKKGWTVARLSGRRSTLRSTRNSILLLLQTMWSVIEGNMNTNHGAQAHRRAAESSIASTGSEV